MFSKRITRNFFRVRIDRTSRPEVFCNKVVLRNFAKFTKLAKFLRTGFFIEHLWWLLLDRELDNACFHLKRKKSFNQIIFRYVFVILEGIRSRTGKKFSRKWKQDYWNALLKMFQLLSSLTFIFLSRF